MSHSFNMGKLRPQRDTKCALNRAERNDPSHCSVAPTPSLAATPFLAAGEAVSGGVACSRSFVEVPSECFPLLGSLKLPKALREVKRQGGVRA